MIIKDVSMEDCFSEEDIMCVSTEYKKIYGRQIHNEITGCPSACRIPSINVKIRADATRDQGNYTHVYVSYTTTRVMVSEEYQLFDFGAIVAAVGGSLGLFLGFSCWQCLKTMVRTCEDLRRRNKKVVFIP